MIYTILNKETKDVVAIIDTDSDTAVLQEGLEVKENKSDGNKLFLGEADITNETYLSLLRNTMNELSYSITKQAEKLIMEDKISVTQRTAALALANSASAILGLTCILSGENDRKL